MLRYNGGSGAVTRQNVTPVSLAIHEQVLLSQLYQSIADRSITVRMELHGMSYDVRHLVVAPVFHAAHGVEDTPLYGFQTIHDMGYGTFQYNV